MTFRLNTQKDANLRAMVKEKDYYDYYYYTHLMALFQDNLGKPLAER